MYVTNLTMLYIISNSMKRLAVFKDITQFDIQYCYLVEDETVH